MAFKTNCRTDCAFLQASNRNGKGLVSEKCLQESLRPLLCCEQAA